MGCEEMDSEKKQRAEWGRKWTIWGKTKTNGDAWKKGLRGNK